MTTIPPPTHICRHCGEPIYREPDVGWVCARSGDVGGTYDLCTENDRSDRHSPDAKSS